MSSFSQYYLPGAVPLWCALFFALMSLWGYARVLRGDESAREFARRGYGFFALSIVFTSLVLMLSLWRRDFRIEYVYQYSGLDLPSHFQVAAFWAGQKGSFLIWLLWGALIGLPLRRGAGRDEPAVMGFYLLNLFGLLFILVRENPFVMLPQTPMDGAGLNPLLQDDWMVIHPPVMFIGYAASAIPISFALAALWRRDTSKWAARAFPWTLAGFLVLGTAILMGGYWAYKTLGWGGYWGWDPVENASLIPWIFGTVLIHGLYMERSRGRYRRTNLILACLVYVSVLYGTFLTRSGVLADFSVHSFVDLGISRWLVLWMLFFIFASIYLIATRWRQLPVVKTDDPMLSRGSFLVLMSIVVVIAGTVITFGTSAPLLTRFMENPGQVGPDFYNRVNLPLALLMALLLACVPFLTWKGTDGSLLRKLLPSFGFAVAITVIAVVQGVDDPFHVGFLFLSAMALTSNLHKVVKMIRQGGFARAGGYVAHIGVGVIFIGILASSAYDKSAKITLEQGQPQRLDNYTLTFKRFIPRQGREKERMEIEVVRDDGFTYNSYPKMFVNDRTRQMMVNPHIHKTVLQDLYISPIEYKPGSPPGIDHRMQLAKLDEAQAGDDLTVRFVDFDLSALGGDPMVQLTGGGRITLGARLEVSQGAATSQPLLVEYSFEQNGTVETPPVALPGGGWIALTGINPNEGLIQLDIAGTGSPAPAATLAIDLTRKPLIILVWYGLYIVLFGGLISTVYRMRTAKRVDGVSSEA